MHTGGTLLTLSAVFSCCGAAEEGPLPDAGRGGRARGLPAAAAAPGGAAQAVGQRPALAGGAGGLHHAGVRASRWSTRKSQHQHVVLLLLQERKRRRITNLKKLEYFLRNFSLKIKQQKAFGLNSAKLN